MINDNVTFQSHSTNFNIRSGVWGFLINFSTEKHFGVYKYLLYHLNHIHIWLANITAQSEFDFEHVFNKVRFKQNYNCFMTIMFKCIF